MRSIALLATVGMFVCSSALAGPLATDPNAWYDGSIYWRGTASVTSVEGDLTADIDYCVYRWYAYPGSDYTPTPGEWVYAYQVYATGAGAEGEVVKFKVLMLDSNEANNISHDTGLGQGAGDAPDDWNILASNQAYWEWTPAALTTHSDGLVYSSINMPQWLLGTVLNHGQYAEGIVPSPSNEIPEPATLGLLALGFVVALRRRRR